MQIKFEGQEHQIDANTLINILTHYNTVVSTANIEYGGGSRNISIKINALEKGSFVIDIGLQETVKTIFSNDTVQYLAGLVTVVGGVFSLYKFRKGKPLKENETDITPQINVKGDKNTIIQMIVKIYNQPVVREAISKSIQTANEDAGVDSLSISGKKTDPVTFEKDEFPDLIYTEFDREDIPETRNEIIQNAVLTIIKLSFATGGQWQFLYKGFKIGMVVKDDVLMFSIDKGARFGKGDAIRVDLLLNQKYNAKHQGYENKSYRITAFHEHLIAAKQPKLDMNS